MMHKWTDIGQKRGGKYLDRIAVSFFLGVRGVYKISAQTWTIWALHGGISSQIWNDSKSKKKIEERRVVKPRTKE